MFSFVHTGTVLFHVRWLDVSQTHTMKTSHRISGFNVCCRFKKSIKINPKLIYIFKRSEFEEDNSKTLSVCRFLLHTVQWSWHETCFLQETASFEKMWFIEFVRKIGSEMSVVSPATNPPFIKLKKFSFYGDCFRKMVIQLYDNVGWFSLWCCWTELC